MLHVLKRFPPQYPLIDGSQRLGWQAILSACLWLVAIVPVSAGTWSSAAPLPLGRAAHTATLLTTGRVLVAGGQGGELGGPPTSSTLLYDPSRDSWSATSSLHDVRALHTATRLADGRVLVVGGYRVQRLSGFFIALGTAEIYDPATGQWIPTAGLAQARYGHTATLLPSGKVLVIGGQDLNGAISGVELYDAVTGTWSAPSVMPTPRSQHTSTLLPNGEVVVVGGVAAGGVVAAADRYDPVDNRWSAAGSIGVPRSAHTATLIPGGAVLVAGGATINSIEWLRSTVRYTSSNNSWRPAADMTSAHGAHVALLLNNGLVLLVGNGGLPELYDPVRDVWSVDGNPASTGSLPTATLATATELADGSVLVIYGAEAHLYVPDAFRADTSALGVPALSVTALVVLATLLLLTGAVGALRR